MSVQAQVTSARYCMVHHEQTDSSIFLKWDKPTDQDSFYCYKIRYRKENENEFECIQTLNNEMTLFHLAGDMVYIIKGFLMKAEQTIQIFDTVCRTKPSWLQQLIKDATLVCDKPVIYKLPTVVHELEKDYLRECHVFAEQPRDVQEKTILVVGVSGTGKRTFINAMINHIVDISFGEDFRFTMVDPRNFDEVLPDSTTTCYRIPRREEFSIDFPLNIIDTPGIYDTRNEYADEEIPFQIRKVFESVVHSVHAVCIVIPLSSEKRMREAPTRIFKSILSLFDENIKKNIHPCLTFDDGGDPSSCLSALEAAGITFEKYFRFNNSDLERVVTDPLQKFQYDKRRRMYKELLIEIGNASPERLKN